MLVEEMPFPACTNYPCACALRIAQMEAPEKITIPDTFNPAEWGKRGGGLGGGGGGFKIPDSFNPASLEREKERTNVAGTDSQECPL